jgi:pimeloyl-ACP methyl ester carboxylesterase
MARFIALIGLLITVVFQAHARAAEPARFSVEVRGSGPDVILIPGLASGRGTWDDISARLAGRYRLHLVQIGGFAGEPAGANAQGPVIAPTAEALHRYISEHHLQHPAVIGHSLGGLMGLMLAISHPEDVGRLMIVDSFPFLATIYSPAATVDMVRPQAEAARGMIAAQSAEAFAASEQGLAERYALDPEARKRIVAWGLASDRAVAAQATYDDLTTDVRPGLGGITVPVTVLFPWEPGMGQPAEAVAALYQKAYAGVPQAKVVRIDGARHFLMLDQPAAFAREVEAFLK